MCFAAFKLLTLFANRPFLSSSVPLDKMASYLLDIPIFCQLQANYNFFVFSDQEKNNGTDQKITINDIFL